MARLILIRHGECSGQGAYIGRRTDPPLSDRGRIQVAELKTSMSSSLIIHETGPVFFYISPMLRALETAEILFGNNAHKFQEVPDFAEIDFGTWDGKNVENIVASESGAYNRWIEDPSNVRPPGGETLTEFNLRVHKALDGVLSRLVTEDGQNLTAVIVAHGGVIRSVICRLLNMPAQSHWAFTIDCASLSILNLFPGGESFPTAVLERLNCR